MAPAISGGSGHRRGPVPLVIWFVSWCCLIGQTSSSSARLVEPFTGTLLILLVTATSGTARWACRW